jgi:hypothetical protein
MGSKRRKDLFMNCERAMSICWDIELFILSVGTSSASLQTLKMPTSPGSFRLNLRTRVRRNAGQGVHSRSLWVSISLWASYLATSVRISIMLHFNFVDAVPVAFP